MSRYVDGFVIPIEKRSVKKYKKMATLGSKIWKEYGALEYYECIGNELKVPFGWTFPKMCKLKPNETAIFSFIVYKNKAQRDRVNKKIMSDPRMKMDEKDMPFSMKRFCMGGFEVLVHS